MASFSEALPPVLRWEGGEVDDPADPGGYTVKGITLRDYRGHVDQSATREQLAALSDDEVAAYYRAFYWSDALDDLDSQAVASATFDGGVNCGPRWGVRFLQRACCDCGYRVRDDGFIGPQTLAAANSIPADQLCNAIAVERERYYRALVEGNPSLSKFLAGWLRRAWSYTSQPKEHA